MASPFSLQPIEDAEVFSGFVPGKKTTTSSFIEPKTPTSEKGLGLIKTVKAAEVEGFVSGILVSGDKSPITKDTKPKIPTFQSKDTGAFDLQPTSTDIFIGGKPTTTAQTTTEEFVQSPANPSTWDKLKEVPKDFVKQVANSTLSALGFIHRTGLQVVSGVGAVTSPAVVSTFKFLGDDSLKDISYDQIWKDELERYGDRMMQIGAPTEEFQALTEGRQVKPVTLFKEQYNSAVKEVAKAEAEKNLSGVLKGMGKIAGYKFMEDWANPFYLFSIKGVKEGSFKPNFGEKTIAKMEINPAKSRFLQPVKSPKVKKAVFEINTKQNKQIIDLTKKGKIKVQPAPKIKLYAETTKTGGVKVKVTNSGGEIFNKNMMKGVIDDVTEKGLTVAKPIPPQLKGVIKPDVAVKTAKPVAKGVEIATKTSELKTFAKKILNKMPEKPTDFNDAVKRIALKENAFLTDKELKSMPDLVKEVQAEKELIAAEKLDKQIELEQEKAIKEAKADIIFKDSEQEVGYQKFKEFAKTRKWMLDPDTDTGILEKRIPSENIYNKFFEGAKDISNDELLDKFKDRLIKERGGLEKITFGKKFEGTGVRLMSGIDPGIDKFIAEDITPTIKKAEEGGKFLFKTIKYIPETILKILEPSKLVEKKLGKPVYSTVTRAIHHPETKVITEFNQKRFKALDKNTEELNHWFNTKFSDQDMKNLMLSRGAPSTPEGRRIQFDAQQALPKELRTRQIKNAIQQLADFNYRFLQKVVGKDVGKVKDYFYGIYKNSEKVDKFLDHWKSTEKFTKEKILPTAADAEAFGLKLRSKNPIDNLKSEYQAIAKLDAMRWLKRELIRTGTNRYIAPKEKSPMDWDKIQDPEFKDSLVEPTLAKLINNLIATNKISRQPFLNAWRQVNNFLRQIKFLGSAFHLGVEAKQSVADAGWLQFYKPTSTRGLTTGFKKNDPIFQTKEYKDYLELGGGHHYSIENQARKSLSDMVDKINRGNYLGGILKVPGTAAKIPTEFVNWMFQSYIPKLKYSKYLDFVAKQEKKLGRTLKDYEKIEIIKEGQNFYGEMNERLFGRSGTVTSALRFIFMAPGFAEGNYRTILKGIFQWKGKEGFTASRSRANMINSLIITGILATVGTLIFKGEFPEKPKTQEDFRDLFKIDTGYKDSRGRKIMIDMLTYDKDYFAIMFNVLRGRPDEAVSEAFRRIGGMKASTLGILKDILSLASGESLYDWKDDVAVDIDDPLLKNINKLAVRWAEKLEPISASVYGQAKNRGLNTLLSSITALAGVRVTKTEEERRRINITSKLWDLAEDKENVYSYLDDVENPKQAIADFNKEVNKILTSELVPQDIKDKWAKLPINEESLLRNKAYRLANPNLSQDDIDFLVKYLKNFDFDQQDVIDYIYKYEDYQLETGRLKSKTSKSHVKNINERIERVKERFSPEELLDEIK